MQYRSLPKHPDTPLPILGFGCMRLPILDHDMARIDEPRAEALIRSAISRGVTYLDTAYLYHAGNSELFLGRLLSEGLRDGVQLATKLPTWHVKTEADFERLLDEQLRRLRTDRIDFYLLHSLSGESWEAVKRLRGLRAIERALADGRIRHAGFSFHGSPGSFKAIVDGFDWDFCQVQYNFLDEDFQAGAAGIRYAAERRVGVIAMEPLRGGALAASGPDGIATLWAQAAARRSPAEWALRWVWNDPNVVVALSGMNAADQLDANIATAESASAGALSAEELALFARVRDVFRAKTKVACTTCGYCQPCPNGVSIPDVFSNYNTDAMFGDHLASSFVYRQFVMGFGRGADRCVHCGECEPKCPQQIPIQEMLEAAHAHLTQP
jgi:uncharacterized protein